MIKIQNDRKILKFNAHTVHTLHDLSNLKQ